jgi:hypothetical protein
MSLGKLERFARVLAAKADRLDVPDTEQAPNVEHAEILLYDTETGEVIPARQRAAFLEPEPGPRPRVIFMLPDNHRDGPEEVERDGHNDNGSSGNSGASGTG